MRLMHEKYTIYRTNRTLLATVAMVTTTLNSAGLLKNSVSTVRSGVTLRGMQNKEEGLRLVQAEEHKERLKHWKDKTVQRKKRQ